MPSFRLEIDNQEAKDHANMTISKKEWGEIKKTVDESIRGATDEITATSIRALRTEIEQFRPRGWRKLLHVLRELSPLGISATLVVSLLALTAGAFYQAFSRIKEEATFQQKTADRLDQIEKDIRGLKVDSVLAQVSSEIKAPNLSKPEIKQIAGQLESAQKQLPELPKVWQVTGDFINYKFMNLLPAAQEISSTVTGRGCRTSMTLPTPIKFENCDVLLEDVARKFHNITENGQHVPVEFVNCLVRYEGGAVPDAPLIFENTIFRVNVVNLPAPRGLEVLRELAESNAVDRVDVGL